MMNRKMKAKAGRAMSMSGDMADKMGRAMAKKGFKEGGSVYRKGADGITHKGKTKGKMVKMAYGGKC